MDGVVSVDEIIIWNEVTMSFNKPVARDVLEGTKMKLHMDEKSRDYQFFSDAKRNSAHHTSNDLT